MSRTAGLTLKLNNFSGFQREMQNLDRMIDGLDKRIDRAGGAFDKLDRHADGASDSLEDVSKQSKRAKNEVTSNLRDIGREASRLERVGQGLTSVGLGVTGLISAPAAALKAYATAASIEFESSFAGVIKTLDTTGLSAEETAAAFGEIRQGILDLATDIDSPVAGIVNAQNELARIAELGGQLGISRDNLIGFTETIGQLTLATELTADAAATAIAQFANITGESEFDRIGATIVALGNNSATTEDQILGFASRLAAAGAQAGFSQADILGLGAAMASVGLNAEAGGTAMTRVFNTLGVAVATGNEHLGVFAETAGITVDEFATLFEEDAAGALNSFVDGISDLSRNDQLNLFGALGFNDIRVQDTLSRLAQSPELLAESISLANGAFAENTALVTEANQRFETTEAKLNLLQNNFRSVAIAIGDAMLPGINHMIDVLVPMLDHIANLNPELLTFGAGLLGIAVAAGPVILFAGQVAGALAILPAISLTPLFIGFGAVLFILNDIRTHSEEVKESFGGLIEVATSIGERLGGIWAGFTSIIQTFIPTIDSIAPSFSPVVFVLETITGMLNQIESGLAGVQGVLSAFNFAQSGFSDDTFLQNEERTNQLLQERRKLEGDIAQQEEAIARSSGVTLDHSIEQGDTLWDIARQYGTTVDELMRLNNLSDSTLSVGQELIITEGGDTSKAQEDLAELNAQIEAIDAQIAKLPTGIQQAFDIFGGEGLFTQLFGDGDEAITNAEILFETMRTSATEFRTGFSDIGTGIGAILAGDFDEGVIQVREGMGRIRDTFVDLFSTIFETTTLGNPLTALFGDSQQDIPLSALTGAGVEIESSSGIMDSIQSFGDTLRTEFENVMNGDFSAIGGLLETNIGAEIGLGLGALALLLPPPVGILAGLAKLVVSAVEADFLGIGTLLEESGISQTFNDAFGGFFGNLFGGEETTIPLSQLTGGGLEIEDDSGGGIFEGIISTFGAIRDSIMPLIDFFNITIMPGLREIGTGVGEFITAMEGTETTGLQNALGWIIDFTIVTAEVLGGGTVILIGAFLSGIGRALGPLGEALSSFISSISNLLEGDVVGFLDGLWGTFTSLATALGQFTLGIADGFIGAINGLTGMELPSADEGLGALVNQLGQLWDVFQTAFDLRRIINPAVAQIQEFSLVVLRFISDALGAIGQDTSGIDAQISTNIDNIGVIRAGQGLDEALGGQIEGGTINLSEAFTFEVDGNAITVPLHRALGDPAVVATLGSQAGRLLDEALTTATISEDYSTYAQLLAAGFKGGILGAGDVDFGFGELLASGASEFDIGGLADQMEQAGIDTANMFSVGITSAIESGDFEGAQSLFDAMLLSGGGEEDINALIADIAANTDIDTAQLFTDSIVAPSLEDMWGISAEESAQFGTDVMAGVAEGLADNEESITQMQSNSDELQNIVTESFGIQSPSLWMHNIGQMLMQGLVDGMNENMVTMIDPIFQRIMQHELNITILIAQARVIWGISIGAMTQGTNDFRKAIMELMPWLVDMRREMGKLPQGGFTGGGGGGGVTEGLAEGGRGEAGAIYRVAEPSIGGLELIQTDAGGSYIISSTGFNAVPPSAIDSSFMRQSVGVGTGGTSISSGAGTSMSFGDVTIVIPEGTPAVTPDIIADGMKQWAESNPPQQEYKDSL